MTPESIILLSIDQVVADWARLEKHLLWPRFMEDYSIEWLQGQIAKNHMHVWALGEEMVVLTQVVILPNGSRVLEIVWAHGRNVDRYIEMGLEIFQRFAHFSGCKRIDIVGRSGWVRKFRNLPGVVVKYLVSCPVPLPEKGH